MAERDALSSGARPAGSWRPTTAMNRGMEAHGRQRRQALPDVRARALTDREAWLHSPMPEPATASPRTEPVEETRSRPLPVLAEVRPPIRPSRRDRAPRPVRSRSPSPPPPAVSCWASRRFVLVSVLRRPRTAARAPARRAAGQRGRGSRSRLALVPGRRPPAQAPTRAPHRRASRTSCPLGPTACPAAAATAYCARAGARSCGCCTSAASRPSCAPGPAGGAVRFRAEAARRETALAAIERMRFALCVDHDLSDFHRRFRRDPLIGPVSARAPGCARAAGPEPFEALAWAISEQLIESGARGRHPAADRRRFGPAAAAARCATCPAPAPLAGCAPAELEACGLSASARWPWCAWRARSPGAGRPGASTSRPGAGCGPSARSARGRSSASPARPGPRRPLPAATSPTSSRSARWPAWPPRHRGRGARRSSRPTRPMPDWPASTLAPAASPARLTG